MSSSRTPYTFYGRTPRKGNAKRLVIPPDIYVLNTKVEVENGMDSMLEIAIEKSNG